MKARWMQYLLLSMISLLGGCVVANTVADPETELRIEPAININPDSSDRPSPLVLRVYELTSRHAFQSSEFFNLYDEAEQTLGNDLVAVQELVVRPGRVYIHPMRLNRETRFIGVLAAFRDIQSAQWRLVFEAHPRGYKTVEIAIDRLTMKRVDD